MDWTIEPTTGDGEAGPLCPASTFPAVVVAVIDLGTHLVEVKRDNGAKEWVDLRKLALVYELGYAKPDGTPFVFWESVTASMHERAKLAKRVSAIVGKVEGAAQLSALLGRQCAVMIANNTGSQGDRVFANLKDVASPLYGAQAVHPRRQPFLWRTDGGVPLPDTSWIPKAFKDSIASMVASSHEAKAGKVAGITPPQPPQQAPQQPQTVFTPPPVPTQFQQPGGNGIPF